MQMRSKDGELFSVWTWFEDDWHNCELKGADAKTAVETAHLFTDTDRPGRLGMIKKVTIVDCDDFTTFLWEIGKGVIFPKPDLER